MNHNRRLILLIALVLMGVALVTLQLFPATPRLTVVHLPTQRPAELTISYSYGIGMSRFNSSAYLSENVSYTTVSSGNASNKSSFTVTPSELDTLYQLFRANHFDTLSYHTVPVNDGGEGTVSVGWQSGTISIPYGDGIAMSPADSAAIKSINSALASLIQRKMANISVPVKIVRDTSLPKGSALYVSIDSSPDLVPLADAQHFVPGAHSLVASLVGGKVTSTLWLTTTVDLQNFPQTLTFSYKNSELLFTLR